MSLPDAAQADAASVGIMPRLGLVRRGRSERMEREEKITCRSGIFMDLLFVTEKVSLSYIIGNNV